MAAKNGHAAVVECLIALEKIHVNAAQKDGVTALFMAAQNGHVKVVELLCGDKRTDVGKARNDGDTPLVMAAYNGHSSVVEVFCRVFGERTDIINARDGGVCVVLCHLFELCFWCALLWWISDVSGDCGFWLFCVRSSTEFVFVRVF